MRTQRELSAPHAVAARPRPSQRDFHHPPAVRSDEQRGTTQRGHGKRSVLRRFSSAQTAHPVDDAVPVGMSDRFDQVATLRTVAPLLLWRGARRQVPLDSVALTTSAYLA